MTDEEKAVVDGPVQQLFRIDQIRQPALDLLIDIFIAGVVEMSLV
jgi:hypothetical protein